MTSLAFDPPRHCGWCLVQPATTVLYATPSCITCASSSANYRTKQWLKAVKNGKREAACAS